MPVTYNPDAAARLKHVASLASRAATAIASIASALADIDYTGGDSSISVNGYSIAVNLSTIEGNLLALKDDGLFVGSDDSKVDKVSNAVAGNFAIFGASGVIVDSGFAFATDTEFNAMLDEYFPVSGTSSVGG